jgi:CBS domain containing-hemolysin-like protein
MLALLALTYFSLLLLLAVVSAMETATFSARDLQQSVAEMKSGKFKDSLQGILANPFHHLHRTLLVSAALNLALAALGLYLVTGPLHRAGVNPWLGAVTLFSITVLLGDVLPKFIAVRSPGTVLLRTTALLHPVRIILDPLTVAAESTSDALLRLLMPKGIKTRQPLTREELETLIEMRQEQGSLGSSEAAIIQEILEITELTVRDCMVPRVDLPMVEDKDPRDEIEAVLEKATTRFGIVHGATPDTVLGVIDIPHWRMAGRPEWRAALQQPIYVPETFAALDALRQHLGNAATCVLIVDEYGGLEGMVTQDEIVDWLLYDAAPWQGIDAEIRETGEGRYYADGTARLDHLADILDIEFDTTSIDTIGGFVFNHLGYLPKPGERIQLEGIEIKVRRVSRHRIQQVELRRTTKNPPTASNHQPRKRS